MTEEFSDQTQATATSTAPSIESLKKGTRKRKVPKLPENPDSNKEDAHVKIGRFPKWLHRDLPKGSSLSETSSKLDKLRLNTVCEEAKCPNRLECYSNKTATFLALGKDCTRACGFCDIDFAKTPAMPSDDEPKRISDMVQSLDLKHAVITMVARDDLEDQGSEHIGKIIKQIKTDSKNTSIEVLTSDFKGEFKYTAAILDAGVEIFNHNLETVRRLTPKVRHRATYDRTLALLSYVKKTKKVPFIKSGIMVGLGETTDEVKETLKDLLRIGVDIVTIGHYLQPNRNKLQVKSFVTPETFKEYADYGKKIGIKHMYSGPFVRSSYNADLLKQQAFGE